MFTGYLFDHRWNNHTRDGTGRVHNAIKKTGEVWCEVLIVRQIGDKRCSIKAQCEEQKDICEHEITTDIADQYQEDTRYQMC